MGQRAAKSDTERRGHHVADAPANPALPGVSAQWHPPGSNWNPAVVRWYRSLDRSGQADYYQQSDADQAWILADVLHRAMRWGDRQLYRIWLTGSRELLTTESARRAAHIRLDPTSASQAQVEAQHDESMNVIRASFGEQTA